MIDSRPAAQTKEIRDAIVTDGFSPEEILQRLDSWEVEWHLTERGDLMIRYWQVAAEDFVPVEHVGRIQEGRESPRAMNELEWLSENLPSLTSTYPGQWIAIVDGEVIASATTLPGLLEKAHDIGAQTPFITEIPAEPIIWSTAYVG